jgi:hypothetical protein
MNTITCITNDPDFFPAALRGYGCTVAGEHLSTCVEGVRCGGCLPRRAEHGFLCRSCWEKTLDALRRVSETILHLRSIENGGNSGAERVSSSRVWKIPVPASWLMADDLLIALGGTHIPSTATLTQVRELVAAARSGWDHPGFVVATQGGAAAAVHLYRAVQLAFARWPEAERDRAIPAPMKCQRCLSHSLTRRSPLEYLGDIVVECEACGATYDWWKFLEDATALVTAIDVARKKAARKARKENAS